MKILLALLALLMPVAAMAADGVSLVSKVFVEHTETTADGKSVTTRAVPDVVIPGDRLVFLLTYHNDGAQPATDLVLTNPVPASVTYSGTDDTTATVSVDGGKTWGALGALTVALADGITRPAEAADVTHIRWTLRDPVPTGAGGELSFRGVVK